MIYSSISLLLISFVCFLTPAQPTGTDESDFKIPTGTQTSETHDPDSASLAWTAVDRQCGSCHHGDRSTKPAALAVFDLRDSCWYCGLTPKQCESVKGRISGASFSAEERTAIVAIIAHLSDDVSTTD